MSNRSVSRRTYAVAILTAVLFAVLFKPAITQTTTPNRLDWPYHGNDAGAMRFVIVDQINPSNVSTLQPAWIFRMNVMSENTSFESQPIIVNGVLYATLPRGHVFALDAATGEHKWTYNPEMPPLSELAICCGQTNRGVSVGNGRVYVGQLDATLVALDAGTGQVEWKIVVDPWQERWTEPWRRCSWMAK